MLVWVDVIGGAAESVWLRWAESDDSTRSFPFTLHQIRLDCAEPYE